ncbi:amidase [Paenibacillus thalictri]|uniref:Amidase n=1 Tax=Paenibacillus thalictri TaxID=2527873 RepID=A0A4Q9DI48_9BACL|nr:amidase [Paenibacillus thalictri]TBL70756.1 amidase [Paenibacillus thalictri]
MADSWGAFVVEQKVEPLGKGPLEGKSFAVKDVYAIAGHISGAGSPDWLRTHEPSQRNAESVERVLRAGACLTGITHTDELMYSLNGENHHYGTPVNPAAPDRIPGGSSSGSAVAAAAGLVDFALGTDTGGSVRIPSSYCGLFGFRPTHGAVDISGVIPLAPSFDTVGWMSRDLRLVVDVARPLLIWNRSSAEALSGTSSMPTAAAAPSFKKLLLGADAWGLADEECQRQLDEACASLSEALCFTAQETVAAEGLAEWVDVFRTIQALEIWSHHGEWIQSVQPAFGPGIAERFAWAKSLYETNPHPPTAKRHAISSKLAERLKDDTLLVIPTAPGPAPIRGLDGAKLELRRAQTLQLTCIAGLCGLPQLTLPAGFVDGAPVGLSLIAGPGQDMRLLEFALSWAENHPGILAGAAAKREGGIVQ